MTSENVTVLFTDMVESTALTSTLPPAEADDLRRSHFAILRQAVAEARGTEVKHLGDGLMAVFPSASAGVSCGVAMQQAVERDGRGRDHPIGLRVGLSTGDVEAEDGDYFGEPVIEAARLCGHCEGGQVLATNVLRLVAGRRSRHECRPVGRLMLKGLPDPVEAVEVLWEPLDADRARPGVPLPGRLAVRPEAGVVGRDTEVTAVLDVLKGVIAGEARKFVVISGEAGQGKTTVVAEAARSAFEGGACVLFGHCDEDIAAPYQLFTEALGHFVTHAPEEQLADHVASWGPSLARLVPALSTRLPGLEPSTSTDADTERYRVFAAVVGLFSMASQVQPIVLVLDDLQWDDQSSLQLLRHLLVADDQVRMLVLGTFRDTELSPSHPLVRALADLHRHGGVLRLQLSGLDGEGVVSLMEAAAGHGLDHTAVRLARAVHRETDGNPFFVSEILRDLAETGAIYEDATTGRWVATGTFDTTNLPASVRTVVNARVGRLGRDAERVLSMAAVIGRDFDLDLLARATGVAEDDLVDILDAAAVGSLVRELTDGLGRYAFAHALIQHTLFEELGRTRQARSHRQVAEALEALCGDRPGPRVGELARHWSGASQLDGGAKALTYSRLAADAALAALAPADARHHYTAALDFYAHVVDPDPILGIDLAIGLGTAQRQTGDPAFRDTLLDAAHRAATLGDTERLVTAVLANNRGIFSAAGTLDADRVDILELALSRLTDDDPSRALVLAKLCSELTNLSSLDRRQALADDALALARSTGDDATIVRVLNDISLPMSMPHLLDQSLEWSTDALHRAEHIGDPVLVFWAAHLRGVLALRAADIAEMDRCMEISWSIAERLDQPILNWTRAYMRSLRAQLAGNTDEAEALATEAFRIGTASGQPDASPIYGVQLGPLMLQRGAAGPEHVPLLEQLAAELPEPKHAMTAGLAALYVEVGRLEEAHHLLRQFAASDFQRRPHTWSWLTTMTFYSTVAVACRDTRIAASLFAQLSPFAEQIPTNVLSAWDPVSHYLGLLATTLGRYDQAEAYFAQAAQFNDRADARFFKANTDLALATMLIERDAPGDAERTRHLLLAAREIALENGYAGIRRQADKALLH